MRYLLGLLLIIGGSISAYAATPARQWQSLETLAQTAQEFVEKQAAGKTSGRLSVKSPTLDSRLRLAQCDQPLQAFLPSGRDILRTHSIGVRCHGGAINWSIYVPVKIKLYQSVVVAAHPLAQRSILSEADLTMAEVEVNRLSRGYFTQAHEVVGKQVRRGIRTGTPIPPYALTEPKIVKKGTPLHLMATIGSLKVTARGYAMQPGGKGDLIQVKNKTSGKIVEAIITGPHEAVIPL